MAAARRRLDGASAIVTGGGSGIGRAVVDRFVEAGAHVTVLERSPERADEVAAAHPDRVRTVVGDVRDAPVHDEVVAVAATATGRIDAYVANAGVWDYMRPLEAMDAPTAAAVLAEVYAVNVVGALLGVRAAIPHLRGSRGSITFTASTSSTYAGGGGVAYVASKHAVLGAMRELAYELQPDIRVNAVAPGGTRTELAGTEALGHGARTLSSDSRMLDAMAGGIPLGFVAEPEDHAALYELLASDDGRFLTGTVFHSDGGMAVPVRRR